VSIRVHWWLDLTHAKDELTREIPPMRLVRAANFLLTAEGDVSRLGALNGSESGGGYFPRCVPRLFRTRKLEKSKHAGKRGRTI
jgi:hypothetical protein